MTKLKLSLTNCYLIPIADKYLLVDTGYSKDKNKFFCQLKKYEINPKDISYLFLTHIHDDHVSLIHELITANPDCKLIYHQNAIKNLALGKNDMSHSFYINKRIHSIVGTFSKLTSSSFKTYVPRENDIIISQNTNLQDLGLPLNGEIVFTPGHTNDSISLILDDGSCFCGDAAANTLSFLGTKHCVFVLEDLDEYYSSWNILLNKNIKTVYPGHGKAFHATSLQEDLNKHSKEKLLI